MNESETAAYEEALAEVRDGTHNAALMAKAFASSEGDQNKTRALYIKWRVAQILESKGGPKLWNPDAAACWSLMFTAVFGAFLIAKNWRVLGHPEEAKKAELWMWGWVAALLVQVVLVALSFMSASNSVGLAFFGLIFWYFAAVKDQVTYVKRKLSGQYRKRSWLMPISIGFISVLVARTAATVIIAVAQSTQPAADTGVTVVTDPFDPSTARPAQHGAFDDLIPFNGKLDEPGRDTASNYFDQFDPPTSRPAQASILDGLGTTEEQRMKAVVEQTIREYPFLDSTSAQKNDAAIANVVELRDYYVSQGLAPSAALLRAASEYGNVNAAALRSNGMIYKCVGREGALTYLDFPCPSDRWGHRPVSDGLQHWRSYEGAARRVITDLRALFGIDSVGGDQHLPGQSGTSWKVEGMAVLADGGGFLIVECRRYTTRRLSQESLGGIAYRILDVGGTGGIVVSPLPLQEGAAIIAGASNIKHITLTPDSTAEDYLAVFMKQTFHGAAVKEGIGVCDVMDATIGRPCKSRPEG